MDAALQLAALHSWEQVQLIEVAERAGCTLADIQRLYDQKEALVDAWFDRADRALLEAASDPLLGPLDPHERLEPLLTTWLETLEPHRRTTRQMICGRLEPGHLHVQGADLLRISRTVQWWRQAARCRSQFLQRALQESVLTGIYLATFVRWLTAPGDHTTASRALLRRLLRHARPIL
nr:TetR/AcrR family transcriptional regulator [Motiliproteus sp. SC1-56]